MQYYLYSIWNKTSEAQRLKVLDSFIHLRMRIDRILRSKKNNHTFVQMKCFGQILGFCVESFETFVTSFSSFKSSLFLSSSSLVKFPQFVFTLPGWNQISNQNYIITLFHFHIINRIRMRNQPHQTINRQNHHYIILIFIPLAFLPHCIMQNDIIWN